MLTNLLPATSDRLTRGRAGLVLATCDFQCPCVNGDLLTRRADGGALVTLSNRDNNTR